MRIVIALGGNALLQKGQALTAENQRYNVRKAAEAIAPLASDHELIISHGNGPQVGLLALQASSYNKDDVYPLDILGAQTEGMIGYLIEQELGNILPFEQPFASILTMVEVDKNDPAFQNPTKPIGPEFDEEDAKKLMSEKKWVMKKVGNGWRRVVPSPVPQRIFQLRPVKWLLEKGTIVICTGGGGIPTVYDENRKLHGAEVVIDKDYASALLAKEVGADIFIMATDSDAVYTNWGTPYSKPLKDTSYEEIKDEVFAEGSMRPKVISACWFAEKTGKKAAIGHFKDINDIVKGKKGTMFYAGLEPVEEVFGYKL